MKEPSELSLRYLKSWADAFLRTAGQSFSALEIDWLIEDVSGRSRLELVSAPEKEFSATEASRFRSLVRRRSRGEPLQHILGYTEFYGYRILVSADALVPRPETEGLVELALEYIASRTGLVILDIGTGTGCIAVAVAASAPGNLVAGIDVSEAALGLARRNGLLHNLDIEWHRADMYAPESFPGDFKGVDLIVSNPPYIPESDLHALQIEVRHYDPEIALTPGTDYLKPYRALAHLAIDRLRSGGAVMVEIEERFGPEVVEIFTRAGIVDTRIHTDLAGRNRIVTGLKTGPAEHILSA